MRAGLRHNAAISRPESLPGENFSTLFACLPIGAYRSSPDGRLLRKQGYRVSTFTSGESALAWIRDQPKAIDLLVTDQKCRAYRAWIWRARLRERPGLRVAIVSGYVDEMLLADAAAGVHEVMAKKTRFYVPDGVEHHTRRGHSQSASGATGGGLSGWQRSRSALG